MPIKNPYIVRDVTAFHIDGCEVKGIPDFDFEQTEEFNNELWGGTEKTLRLSDKGELSMQIKINRMLFYKLTGVWDWVIKNCPNRRVVHFMRYGKNDRIKEKNFKRAMRILGKELRKYG